MAACTSIRFAWLSAVASVASYLFKHSKTLIVFRNVPYRLLPLSIKVNIYQESLRLSYLITRKSTAALAITERLVHCCADHLVGQICVDQERPHGRLRIDASLISPSGMAPPPLVCTTRSGSHGTSTEDLSEVRQPLAGAAPLRPSRRRRRWQRADLPRVRKCDADALVSAARVG